MADPIIQKGFGCVWGIGTANISSGTGVLLPLEEDLTMTRQTEQHYLPADGSVIGETYYRKESLLRIRIYPGGGNMSQATSANQGSLVFEPGMEIQLFVRSGGPVEDPSDDAIDGFWCILELGKQRRHADKAYWDMTLRRWGNNFVSGSSGTRISQTVT